MVQLLVFGASNAYGAWDSEGGWVQRLRKYLESNRPTGTNLCDLVYNLGISGNTSDMLMARFENEVENRMFEGEETVFIFDIGKNDSCFDLSKNDLWVAPEKFEQNLIDLIKIARKYSSKIAFVGLCPIDDSRTTPVQWDKDLYYKTENILTYNDVVKSICKKEKIPFVDILSETSALDHKALIEDGLHFNDRGHEKIFSLVKETLIKERLIQ